MRISADLTFNPQFQAALMVVLDSLTNHPEEGCDQEIEYGFANPQGNRKQRRAWASQQRRGKH